MKTAESSSNRQKILREKETLLLTSNFSFSNSIFKRLALQTHKNQNLFGKGLKEQKSCDNELIAYKDRGIETKTSTF